MKRFLLSCSSLLISFCHLQAATIKWDGEGGDGLWSTTANWVGDIIPGAADNVLLDNSSLTANYTITLPAGNISISLNSLIIAPSAANIITVILPSANTSATALHINGAGDAFVLNKGAVFINSSGATAGTPVSVTNTNFFRINNGGRYIHNTARGHTNGLVARLSAVAGTENGVFEFDVPFNGSYFISASGRTFGKLVFSGAASAGMVTYVASGASALTTKGDMQLTSLGAFTFAINNNINIDGDLLIDNGCKLNISSNTNNTIVHLKGDLLVAGLLTETGTGLSSVELNGIANQNVNAAGSISNDIDLTINNTAGATLLSDLYLPHQLILSSGKIKIGANTLSTTVVVGGSANNYIATNAGGFLEIRNLLTSVIFPVGPNIISYDPVSVTGGTSGSLAIRVEQGINPAIANPFPSVVDRTWVFNTASNLSPVNVSFQFNGNDCMNGFNTSDPAELGINLSNTWNVLANNLSITGTGPFVVSHTLANFNTSYIIGNNGAVLPIDFFITCTAQKRNNDAFINWTITDPDHINNFEVQRSVNGQSYQTIATIPSVARSQYNYIDATLAKGKNLYRIKVNKSGPVSYSNIVVIINNGNSIHINSVIPDPVVDVSMLSISADRVVTVNFALSDISGRMVKQWNQFIARGNTALPLSMDNLPPGIYYLTATSIYGVINNVRIMKE